MENTAKQFLKDKGIHPIEPIYWDLGKSIISLDELLEEYSNTMVDKAIDEAFEIAEEYQFSESHTNQLMDFSHLKSRVLLKLKED